MKTAVSEASSLSYQYCPAEINRDNSILGTPLARLLYYTAPSILTLSIVATIPENLTTNTIFNVSLHRVII